MVLVFGRFFSRSIIGGKWRIAHRSTQSYICGKVRRVHVVLLMKREKDVEIQLFNAKRLPKKIWLFLCNPPLFPLFPFSKILVISQRPKGGKNPHERNRPDTLMTNIPPIFSHTFFENMLSNTRIDRANFFYFLSAKIEGRWKRMAALVHPHSLSGRKKSLLPSSENDDDADL